MLTLKGKLLIGVGLVLAMVGTLTISSLWAILSYREVVHDLDRNLNRVPQRRELIEAFAGMLEPLRVRLPDDANGRQERLWQFNERLAEAELRTGEALQKLAKLPSQPDFAKTCELAQERLWEIDNRLQELRVEQRKLLDPEQSAKTKMSLLLQVNDLQASATAIPDFGTSLPQLLKSSSQTYRASLWWVSVTTGLVVLLLFVGLFAGRHASSRSREV
ncbi:MAG: integral membrane sensor signal transduction histidine kinase [Planctomycetota bacterium]|nr:MAG: integral membrane sensor signal transduction histidine kinase [Planctomycetota bacterium]